MTLRRVWTLLLITAAAWALALLHRGSALGPDEVEFFRATRWTGLGLVPFRDFWEHHTPLQWLLFAPVARLFGGGPGTEAIIAMRWAQLPLWFVAFVLIARVTRREGVSAVVPLALLLISPTFVRRAVEYRVDVPGTLAFVAAIALIARGATRARWIVFGALMSASVLANMRLAPVVIAAALLALFRRAEDRVWRWNPRAIWMTGGVAAVASGFIGWLWLTRSFQAFLAGAIEYNITSAKLVEVRTFFDAFLLPLWSLDIAGMIFWLASAAGLWLVLRDLRTAGPLQYVALLAIVSIVTVAAMEVHYDYHFQLSWLLMLPLAAAAVARMERPLWQGLIASAAVVALIVSLSQTVPSFGRELHYQDTIMTEADRLTSPDAVVLDGAGYALRRTPAWRYWFLTTGVRLLAAERLIDPYGVAQMSANPPGAIIHDYRLGLYMQIVPDVARYAVSHYVPVYRNLWLPGATMRIGPGVTRVRWIAPRAGQFSVWSAAALSRHPWFNDPLRYASTRGPIAARFAIPLAQLRPLPADALEWRVDGVAQPAGVRTLELRKGSRVELTATSAEPAGVMLVPAGVRTLAVGPPEEFLF